MEITDIKIKPVFNKEKLKAYASVTFDKCFVIHELKIIEGKKGKFVAMPSKKLNNARFIDIVHPINNDVRNMIQEKVLKKYEEEIKAKKEEKN
ncbi:MAG TPA: septation regulator SpoVG [bacterium]|nr:septation regulator SpoVG [bacterium]HOL46845.1 septation regulator SpoVG [bacterium]HPQ18806.1 septation regulator SpoVG [bacterium]